MTTSDVFKLPADPLIGSICGGEAERRAGGQVTVVALGGKAAFSGSDALSQVFRHRYLLANYLGFSLPIFALFLIFGPTEGPNILRMPLVLLGLVAMLCVIGVYIWLVRLLLSRRVRQMEIPLTPGLLIGVCILLGVTITAGHLTGGADAWTPLRTITLFFVVAVYVEMAAAFILGGPVRRAVARLQMDARQAEAARAAGLPATPKVAEPEPPADGANPSLLAGVLRLEAQGNHVLVVTERGRHLVPGPFGAMVARLPAELGRQVHRSHWVAASAVQRARRSGRDVVIETLDGARVPVASTQYGRLRDWLAQASADFARDGVRPAGRRGGDG